MPRDVRRSAQMRLPEKAKWATHVPILVIPSGGHSRLAEGTEIAVGNKGRRQEVDRRTPTNSRVENEVPLQYAPCCDEHRKAIEEEGVSALVPAQQLQGLANRLSQHYGHGALQPRRARIEWAPVKEEVPCQDCLDAAKEAAKKAS